MKKQRYAFIDILKVLAIFLVLAFHFLYIRTPNNSLRPIGFIGISLFFIISGYVLAKNYPNLKKFSLNWFLKRYARIAPIYYLSLIFLVIIFAKQCYSGNVFGNLFSHFLFIDSFFKDYSYGIISPAWFLVPLICLYFVFPFLNNILQKRWFLFLPIFAITLATMLYYSTYTSFNFLFFLGQFCFGIVFAHGKKLRPLLISLSIIFIKPIMFAPFLIFFIFSFINKKYISQKAISFLASQTIALFLLHEGLFNLILNKWHIYNIPKYPAIFLYLLSSFLIFYLSTKIQERINSKTFRRRIRKGLNTLFSH